VRLQEAALALGIDSPTLLASALAESPQTITNWARRGVSKAGALAAQQRFGISATWIISGQGSPKASASTHLEAEASSRSPTAPIRPSLSDALRVVADAAARSGASERASAAGLLRELVIDPKRNADDLIPIITRRLS
jgi:hypothetical protein